MNRAIGILILVLYFSNYHICEYFFYNDIYKWYQLKYSILAFCMVLSIKYKSNNNLIEKLFNSIVINDIYVLIFKNETTYTLNDLWMIGIFFVAQYIGKKKKDE